MVEPGSICNEIVGSHDWLPTFLNAVGDSSVVDTKVKRHARLNVISHLLSLIPCEDLTPKPIKLPPREKSKTYQHPDMSGYSHVPKRYP